MKNLKIYNIYSKRQKVLNGEMPDIYVYDNFPQKLRIQIVHILNDSIGSDTKYYKNSEDKYNFIHKALCREYGKFTLSSGDNYQEKIQNFLLHTKSYEEVIDVVELLFRMIDLIIRKDLENHKYATTASIGADQAIAELNERFKENGIGYSYENGNIIRIDSTYIHKEVTKPSLALLSNSKFLGANGEFLKAHQHYRDGRNKECLNDCLKALESTLKTICKEKGWEYKETDTSKKLIQTCFKNNLVPSFTQNQFTSLQNLLESGIPTLRNKLGGHGQGHQPIALESDITRYGLNLTASNILFLIEKSKIV